MEFKASCIIKCMVLILTIIINYSCATVTLKNQDIKRAASYAYSKSSDSLTIAVDPISKHEDCMQYFGTDLIANRILPILIIVENKNKTTSFTIFKEQISMQHDSVEKKLTNDFDRSQINYSGNVGKELAGTGATIATGAVFMPVGALAAAPFLLVAGGKQISDSATIKYNFAEKEFRTKTITPENNSYGYVYLKIPDSINLNNTEFYKLTILAKDIENDKQLNFEFKISL